MTQLLPLVCGGELLDPQSTELRDLAKVHLVGMYPSHAEAHKVWKAGAQRSLDNAQMRYYIAHLHRLPDEQSQAHRRIKG